MLKNVAYTLALFSLVQFSAVFVIDAAVVVVAAAPKEFTEVARFQNYFSHKHENSKCKNDVYNALLKPILADTSSSEAATKRMYGYIFSQIMLVGRVRSLSKVQNDTSGNAFYIVVSVECYLRGDMGLKQVQVRQLGASETDERCFPLPIENLQPMDRVLVYGNVAADQHGILPIEGGVQKLASSETATQASYLPLLCIKNVEVIIPPKSEETPTDFCKRTTEIENLCDGGNELFSMLDLQAEITDKLNLLKPALKEENKEMLLTSLKLNPYVFSEYVSRRSPVAFQTSSEKKCNSLVCATCILRYSTSMLLLFVCTTVLVINKLV